MRSALWWLRWVPAALLVVVVAALVVVAGQPVLLPLILGFAFAFMLEPVMDWLQRRGMSRGLAAILTIVATGVVVVVALVALVPPLVHQLRESAERLPMVVRATAERMQWVNEYAREHLSEESYERLRAAIESLKNDPSAITSRLQEWVTQGLFGLVSLGSTALGLLVVPFFVYYLLLDMGTIRRFVEEHIPVRHRGVGERLFDEIGSVVRGYVRGRFLLALCMAALYTTGLAILGVPVPAAIGLIAGIVGIIPYLGVTTGVVLALGFAALDGAGLLRLGGVVGVFALAQLVEDYILTPRLIGERLELHPMLVFIALIIAGDLFGLLGLVLAIPVLAVLKVLGRFVDELYLHSAFYCAPAPAGGPTVVQRAAEATVSPAVQRADAAAAAAARAGGATTTGKRARQERKRRG